MPSGGMERDSLSAVSGRPIRCAATPMSDHARPDQLPSAPLPRSGVAGHLGMGLAALLQVLATAALVTVYLYAPRSESLEAAQIALGSLAILATLWVCWCCARIQQVASRLTILLRGVRDGREPVASLAQLDGPLAALASACHDLAHDLRAEKARTSQLENETRQRIANRTHALERTIGTLRQQAARDGLTGLFNRRSMDAYLPDAINRCRSAGAALCLLMIDIDYFKPLNDTLGHASGDQMLKSVAQIIRSTIREHDLAFRSGGDEFVVVLEECDGAAGRVIADRLAALGDSLGRTFRLIPPPALSIGQTTLAEAKEPTAAGAPARADEALYLIKAAHHAASASSSPRKSA